MSTVRVGDVSLAYDSTGEGPAVVLIGGSGMPRSLWEFSCKPGIAAAGYQVVTFDGRGVGESDGPPPPYSVTDLAQDTIGLIEELAIGPCHLVGLSLGGFVAEEVACRRPDLVCASVLVASAGRTTAYVRAKVTAEEELFSSGLLVPESYDTVETLSVTLPARVLQDDDDTVMAWLELLDQPDTVSENGRLGQGAAVRDWLLDDSWHVARLPEIDVPTLVVSFEHDLWFPPSRGQEVAEALPRGSFTRILGVAHGNGAFEAASRLSQVITDFLATQQ